MILKLKLKLKKNVKYKNFLFYLFFKKINFFSYLSAPEKDDVNNFINNSSTDEENKNKNKNTNTNTQQKDAINNNNTKRKSRFVLNEIKPNSKKSKKYALEFENVYDNFERESNFEEKIECSKLNYLESLESKSALKENNCEKNPIFKKKPSLIIPYDSPSKKKIEESKLPFDLYDNDDEYKLISKKNDTDETFCQNLLKRKSSIFGILKSNVNEKKNIE